MNAKFVKVVSDLHMEFMRNSVEEIITDIIKTDERDKETILVLAGDISSRPLTVINTIKECEKRFHSVIYVPGNHEFYHNDTREWNDVMMNGIENLKNISLLNVKSSIIENTRFVFGILWADGGKSLADNRYVERCLNDFTLIKINGALFTVEQMIDWHKQQKADIIKFLKEPFNGKTIVVTHHLPSYTLISERFKNKNPLKPDMNGGFACYCDDIFESDYAPSLWIHGHTHDTIDTIINKTRVVCNPYGYSHEWNNSYNKFLIGPKIIPLDNLLA